MKHTIAERRRHQHWIERHWPHLVASPSATESPVEPVPELVNGDITKPERPPLTDPSPPPLTVPEAEPGSVVATDATVGKDHIPEPQSMPLQTAVAVAVMVAGPLPATSPVDLSQLQLDVDQGISNGAGVKAATTPSPAVETKLV